MLVTPGKFSKPSDVADLDGRSGDPPDLPPGCCASGACDGSGFRSAGLVLSLALPLSRSFWILFSSDSSSSFCLRAFSASSAAFFLAASAAACATSAAFSAAARLASSSAFAAASASAF